MPEEWENAIEWLEGQKTATVTLHSQKIRNRVLALAKEHPDKVKIVARPDEKGQDGYLLAHIPASWIAIRPTGIRQLSEEQKEAAAKRLRAARENKTSTKKNPG